VTSLRRRSPEESGGGTDPAPTTGVWATRYPNLAEFLSATHWPGGEPRTTATFSLFTDTGVWKCCISDREQGLVSFVTGASPDEVLEAAERGLDEDSLTWRPAFRKNGRKG